ncbi:sensor histidine kinase [Bailinhaonella thermotolerans]|uniref:Sensor histidine kinase n=1 Tax=Bailinhaonella thermotolerans TaxID=1070861 RepID=A0A3A4B1Q7_9ACTN|nr:sensor histidine kinase [Bailinhaonella thermotolerans]RJL31957.1 sensor histidine kinase [Bailinhaonella thermotolerans]
MITRDTVTEPAPMVHQGNIYGSDEEFLAMAVPFAEQGLAAGEPVLAATTARNIELLYDALGPAAEEVDYAETAYFGRRPPQRVAAFHRYWLDASKRNGGRHVRIIAEPVWNGRSTRDVLAWKRMESALNLVLAPTGIWMICPYDSRVVPDDVLLAAEQTHPSCMQGDRAEESGHFVDPLRFFAECDTPLPPPPADAATLRDAGFRSLRDFLSAQAAARGIRSQRAMLLVTAVNEAVTYLSSRSAARPTVRLWTSPGALLCQIDQPGAEIDDPILGLRAPTLTEAPGDGMWLTRQICDHVDIRNTPRGATIRLHFPTSRAAELLQAPTAVF